MANRDRADMSENQINKRLAPRQSHRRWEEMKKRAETPPAAYDMVQKALPSSKEKE
jgi:DNA-binding ferritin-like protein (Dps family)